MKIIRFLAVLLPLAALPAAGSEFTIKEKITVQETGYSSAGDPVEAFENAVEQAKKTAASSIGAQIKGGSQTEDGTFSSEWVEKKANVQIFDVRILEKEFVSPGEVRVRMRMTAGYLNATRFWHEYDKTGKGATLRAAVWPGWGQIYNREYFSAGLYGLFYTAFYGFYVYQLQGSPTSRDVNSAFVRFQLPALVFWTLAVSDASISRYMLKFGLEQIKSSYQAFVPAAPAAARLALFDLPVLRYGF